MKLIDDPSRPADWGIRPVPPTMRDLSTLDVGLLWGDLGVGLLVLVSGALLVPALGFWSAFSAIVIGSIIGVGLLATAARAGAERGVPTMALFRPILGVKGSYIPSSLNVAQLIGWTAVELWAMSSVADLVSRRVFDFSARWLWLFIAAVVCAGMALWGPIGVARTYMKKFAGWVVLGLCVALSVLVLTSDGLSTALGAGGTGGFPTYGAALDLVIAMPISWLPLVADYTRFARSPRGAAIGTFGGYLIANVWLYSLGALLVLSTGTAPDPAGMAAGILVLAGGWISGTMLLFGLLVGETDEAFADIYSAALSIRNVFPRLSQRSLVLAITGISVPLAGLLTMQLYESFLFLIGSVFVPLFGVLIAALVRDRLGRRNVGELDEPESEGVRGRFLLPWIAGFLLYHWITPTGPDWWIDATRAIVGTPLAEKASWLPASLPSFAVAFGLTVALRRSSTNGGALSSAAHETR